MVILGNDSIVTPPKTNMKPEKGPLEKGAPLQPIHFGFHVSFWGCT